MTILSRLEGATQENARLYPVALHGAMCQSERVGRFLLGQAAEEPTLHDFDDARLDDRDSIERIVDLQHDVRLIVDGEVYVIEGDASLRPAAFERSAFSGAVDDDMPHGQRRNREKMRMVAPLPARLFRELEIRFVHQRGRRQGAALATVAITTREPKVRDSTKLVIGERDDFVERFLRGVVFQHGIPLGLNERARAATTTVPTYPGFRGGDSRAAFIHFASEA